MTLSKAESITDFFVQAVIDGTRDGVFKKETRSNWHRKHKQHHSNYYSDFTQSEHDFRTRKLFSNHTTNTATTTFTREASILQSMKNIRVDESGSIILPNINGKHVMTTVVLNNKKANNSSHIKRLKLNNHIVDHCNQDYWHENMITNRTTQFTRKWTYTKTDLKNKTVSFRYVSSKGTRHRQ